MSDQNSTHFHFRLGGIELEISGDRKFVETMYKRVMRDIEAARRHVALPPKTSNGPGELETRERQILWVHRCSPMMHKIYMSSPAELDRAPLLSQVETANLAIIFADSPVFERILPGGGKGHTLWAELTEKGRRKIAEASVES